MKKHYSFLHAFLSVLLVILLLSGCSQTAVKVSSQSDNADNARNGSSAQNGKKVRKIVFNQEIPDPQASKMNGDGGGTAVSTGKAKIDLELLEVSPNVYEGMGEMSREMRQEATLEEGRGKISSEILTQYRLGKIQVKIDGGKVQGSVPVRARMIDNKIEPTGPLLTMHLHKTAGIFVEYPYTIALDGDKVKLALTINPMAVLSFEGKVTEGSPRVPAAARPVTAAGDTDWLIYVNDMYSVPIDQNTEAQYWITLTARKSGGKDAYGTYRGKLFAAAFEGDRLPWVKGSADGSNNADYLGEVEFELKPFDAGQYRANGGYDTEGQGYTGLAILKAGLNGHGKEGALDRGGQVPVLITLRGEEVGVELPTGKMKDGFRGSLIHSGDLAAKQREAEDTSYLNRLFAGYYEAPGELDHSQMPDLSQYGLDPSALQSAKGDMNLWGGADTPPSWYPAEWIPKINPISSAGGIYIVQQPFFGGFMSRCSLQYTESKHFFEVWPVYKAALSRHPGYVEKENPDLDLEAEADTLFKIGKYTVNVNVSDCPAGTRIAVTILE